VTAPQVRELLAGCAGSRQRTADEHMFAVTRGGSRMATFRLQIFTAPGARPVAIAIQTTGEGASLMNGAERYAGDVWRRHFPDLAEPPVWIELQLFPDLPDSQQRFTLVTFSKAQPYELAGPRWCRMSDADVALLVGAQVDRGRGHGYQPWPPEPEELPVYQVVWVAVLPRPEGVDRGCMNGAAPWRRSLGRQFVRRRGLRDCCYYHSINWHQVSAAAIQITRQARAEGVASEEFTDRVLELARASDLPVAERQALAELLDAGSGIQIEHGDDDRRFYINGRHRTTAMLDAGVRRTVVIRWEMPGPG
jgi:hypothetical protein